MGVVVVVVVGNSILNSNGWSECLQWEVRMQQKAFCLQRLTSIALSGDVWKQFCNWCAVSCSLPFHCFKSCAQTLLLS